jgi:hypothetical protein
MDSLGEVLDRLDAECKRSTRRFAQVAAGREKIARDEDARTIHIGSIPTVLGARAFGPILVVAGLFCVTPVGVIPGVPTMLAILVLIVSVQHVVGKDSLWLPGFILRRELKTRRVARSVELLRHVARPIDRFFRPRLTWLVEGGGARVVGLTTALMAVFIPPLEFVPFSVTIPAVALAGFGLGILIRDGLLLLATFLFVAGAFTVLPSQVVF